jgi:hypothetical protein
MIAYYTSRLTISQLFLHFHGPVTILVSSRGAKISDVLTSQDVNEIADSPAGAVPLTIHAKAAAEAGAAVVQTAAAERPTMINYASVGEDGNVKFDDVKASGKGQQA